jgi:hypothetical protein
MVLVGQSRVSTFYRDICLVVLCRLIRSSIMPNRIECNTFFRITREIWPCEQCYSNTNRKEQVRQICRKKMLSHDLSGDSRVLLPTHRNRRTQWSINNDDEKQSETNGKVTFQSNLQFKLSCLYFIERNIDNIVRWRWVFDTDLFHIARVYEHRRLTVDFNCLASCSWQANDSSIASNCCYLSVLRLWKWQSIVVSSQKMRYHSIDMKKSTVTHDDGEVETTAVFRSEHEKIFIFLSFPVERIIAWNNNELEFSQLIAPEND